MCAIVDANAANEVFWFGQGPDPRPEAGRRFFDWAFGPPRKLTRSASRKRRSRLVVGGKLLSELRRTLGAERMRTMREAQLAGTIVRVDAEKVRDRAQELETKEAMESDDPHVLGLALVSGARLLYTNDLKLQKDFTNPALIRPRGKVYSTVVNRRFTDVHEGLLKQRNLCARQGC